MTNKTKFTQNAYRSPNDKAERRQSAELGPSEIPVTCKNPEPSSGKPFVPATLFGNSEIKQWIDKCGTPVIYQNGWKRQDDDILRRHPISCYLSSLSVRLLHIFRNYISRRIYGKQWKRYVSPNLYI